MIPASKSLVASTMALTAMMPTTTLAQVSSFPSGFRQIGQTLTNKQAPKYGTFIQLSDDGTRMAVASQNVVSVFNRDDSSAVEDIANASWQPLTDFFMNSKQGRLSLSGDGSLLALRHEGTVQIYNLNGLQIPTTATVCAEGKQVLLGKTPSTSVFGEAYWLIVSCENFDKNRGKVEILVQRDQGQWVPFTTITGSTPGALFGYSTGFNVHHDQPAMVAIGSPFDQQKQGLVKVFSISQTGLVTQQGQDLSGQDPGDKFGFDLALSSAGVPHLVVGAPDCQNKRGCVSAFVWNGYWAQWEAIGAVVTGDQEQESLGRAVAISKSGTRIAASSVRRGLVRMYEYDSQLTSVGVLQGAPGSQWGFDIALNDSGSMVASGAIAARSVQVFLDDSFSPFVSPNSVPSASASPSSPLSVAPSALPSASPSHVPGSSPTRFPSHVSSSSSPSQFPSQVPSRSPSSFASDQPSIVPSAATPTSPKLYLAGALPTGILLALGFLLLWLRRQAGSNKEADDEEVASDNCSSSDETDLEAGQVA